MSLEHQTFNFTNPIGKDEAKSLQNELIRTNMLSK